MWCVERQRCFSQHSLRRLHIEVNHAEISLHLPSHVPGYCVIRFFLGLWLLEDDIISSPYHWNILAGITQQLPYGPAQEGAADNWIRFPPQRIYVFMLRKSKWEHLKWMFCLISFAATWEPATLGYTRQKAYIWKGKMWSNQTSMKVNLQFTVQWRQIIPFLVSCSATTPSTPPSTIQMTQPCRRVSCPALIFMHSILEGKLLGSIIRYLRNWISRCWKNKQIGIRFLRLQEA